MDRVARFDFFCGKKRAVAFPRKDCGTANGSAGLAGTEDLVSYMLACRNKVSTDHWSYPCLP
jgi:hypothetical protein